MVLLGIRFLGYLPVGDTDALAQLLHRTERDPLFLKRLTRAIARRAALFRPAREKANWKKLIEEIVPKPARGVNLRVRKAAKSSAVTVLTHLFQQPQLRD